MPYHAETIVVGCGNILFKDDGFGPFVIHKLEEYFEVFAADMPVMHDFWMSLVPFALYFSVLMCAAEVILGVALIVSWRLKQVNWVKKQVIMAFVLILHHQQQSR